MSNENCFCHLNGFQVKDAVARKRIENFKSTYNVLDYGVIGDGVTDNYATLDTLAYMVYQNGGGTLFFPSGKYNISGTLYIGDNIRLKGEGISTYLYGTDENNYMGTFLAVAGDNVAIEDIKVGYADDSRDFVNGANQGAIGVGTFVYEEARQGVYTNINHKNVLIRNIYSDSTYPLQTENKVGYTVENVAYENIYAENGCVSMTANSDYGVNNCSMHNVICSYLRAGWGLRNNVIVENCVCNIADFKFNGGMFNNVSINFDTKCAAYKWNIRQDRGVPYILWVTEPAVVNNVAIDCGGVDGWYGAQIDKTGYFNNIRIVNPGGGYACCVNAAAPSQFVNCDFEGSSVVYGNIANSNIAQNSASVNEPINFSDDLATDNGNWGASTSRWENYFGVKDGYYIAHIMITSIPDTAVKLYKTIKNDAYKPQKTRTILGTLFNESESKPAWLAINADGTVTVETWDHTFLSGSNNFVCNGETRM